VEARWQRARDLHGRLEGRDPAAGETLEALVAEALAAATPQEQERAARRARQARQRRGDPAGTAEPAVWMWDARIPAAERPLWEAGREAWSDRWSYLDEAERQLHRDGSLWSAPEGGEPEPACLAAARAETSARPVMCEVTPKAEAPSRVAVAERGKVAEQGKVAERSELVERSEMPEPGEVPELADLPDDPFALDESARQIVRARQRRDRVMGRDARLMMERRLWREAGFLTFAHYCRERLGCTDRSLQQHIQLDRGCDRMPELDEAYTSGELSFSRALGVARVAQPSTALAWVRFARRVTCQRLAAVVAEARRQRDRSDEWTPPPLPPPVVGGDAGREPSLEVNTCAEPSLEVNTCEPNTCAEETGPAGRRAEVTAQMAPFRMPLLTSEQFAILLS